MTFEPTPPPTILPIVDLNDYDAFRSILGSHIPDTYDEWLNLFAQWEKDWGSNDALIRRIKVNSGYFSRHLSSTGHAPTLNELFVFAARIANND
jgi:hypothetical protein